MKQLICNRGGRRIPRHKFVLTLGWLAIVMFAGCASSEIKSPPVLAGQKPTGPTRIMIQDFVVTPLDLPVDSPWAARLGTGREASSAQIALDRKLGAEMSAQLIAALREMGLRAERPAPRATPQANDVFVRGCFVSNHGTNAPKPLTVGFDFDALELLTKVQSYRVTGRGVGHTVVTSNNPSGIITTSAMKIGDKASVRSMLDGWGTQTVREIAESLKSLFQEQGWSN